MPVGCCCVGGLARQRGVREAGCGLLAWLQATLHVSHLKQGFERGELALLNEKGVKVGTAKVGACDGTTASQLACCLLRCFNPTSPPTASCEGYSRACHTARCLRAHLGSGLPLQLKAAHWGSRAPICMGHTQSTIYAMPHGQGVECHAETPWSMGACILHWPRRARATHPTLPGSACKSLTDSRAGASQSAPTSP